MFAPPPVQLSRSEIQTRLEGEAKNADRVDSPDKSSDKSSQNTSSLHRNESRSPISPFIKRFTGKTGRRVVSPPPTASPPSSTSERKKSTSEAGSTVKTELDRVGRLPAGFGENPRAAPEPPKRPAPIPNDLWRPPLPGAFPLPQESVSDADLSHDAAPPIPPKSARRPIAASIRTAQSSQHQSKTAASEQNLSARLANLEKMPTRTQRASSLPSVTSPNYSHPTPGRMHSAMGKQIGVRDARVRKASSTGKPILTAAYHGLFYPETTNTAYGQGRRATEGMAGIQIQHPTGRSQSPQVAREDKNIVKDLSIAKPLQQQAVISNKNLSGPCVRLDAQDRLRFMEKALPDTPTSVIQTPNEIPEKAKLSSLTKPKRKSQRSQTSQRSPLAQVTTTDIKANSPVGPELGAWPGRLPAIPEHRASEEKIPLTSGSSAVGTQMHLRGGSVVTVTAPEHTPWHRTLYIQGPIKLPKPVIVPRKNSLASLEPFQEAVDQMYQDALYIPRRRSDNTVLDDVCDFFDDFGFEQVAFLGDILAGDGMEIDDPTGIEHSELERFSTPPVEPLVSPIERTVARDIVEHSSPSTAPISKSESNDANAAASLAGRAATLRGSHQPRKDSMTLSKFDTGVSPSSRTPKAVVLDGSYGYLHPGSDAQKANKMPEDPKIAVKELDASSEWIAPALLKRVWSKQNIIREKSIHRKVVG